MVITTEESRGTLTVTVKLSRRDCAILGHDLLDVPEWVAGAVEGKINSCAKRLAAEGSRLLVADGADMVPTKQEALIDAALNHPAYLNRAARDAAEEARRQPPEPINYG